jgi:hypothetical protein
MAKVGRNEPCPCGSGKKYKKCHGVNAQASALNEVARIGYKWIDMMVKQTLDNAIKSNESTPDAADHLLSLNWLCDFGDIQEGADIQETQSSEIELDQQGLGMEEMGMEEMGMEEMGMEDEVEIDASQLEGAAEMTESGDLKADAKLSKVLKTVDLNTSNRRDRRLYSQLKLSLSQSTLEPFEVLEVLRGSGFKVKGCFTGRVFQINQAHDAAQLEPMEWLYGRVVIFGRRAYLLQGWEKVAFRSRKALKKEVLAQLGEETATPAWLRTQASWLLDSCRKHKQSKTEEASA